MKQHIEFIADRLLVALDNEKVCKATNPFDFSHLVFAVSSLHGLELYMFSIKIRFKTAYSCLAVLGRKVF
ncbi:unnamed protein product [Fusarium graminearum]|uniref:Chromosome 3, complete genome n=2 Tax=Gibberella zeae TaxID=5518 RepID=A0A098E0X6_GIBZE|nr:unnamed protein product [Fusarium graminearum]CAF3589103.1 unnamed protein product [Fusarium graminearum]CAG1961745.1 unnamed protein product [Fusarium graminearum]CAG1966357.1 unnamed protein product [Fusarium graminearum]CAG1967934.1 unnamed protein product [Fusarium graminearum]